MWIIYVGYECLKSALNVFPIIVFTRRGQRYLPFVDEGFYKVWGPIAAIVTAGLSDHMYFLLLPIYVVLFEPRVALEWAQIRTTRDAAFRRLVRSGARR
jgi:hypothetical protein